jgi:hypothetical protein
VAKSGSVTQLVDTDVQSWCQAGGNSEWLSIENEGRGGESLTTAAVESCARILAKANQVYAVPLRIAESPLESGLGHHSMGGVAWGSHPQCPGVAIISQKPEIIRLAMGEIGESGVLEEDDDMRSLMRYQNSPHVFLTDGLVARWIRSEGEMADLQALSADGTIRLGYNGRVRIVTRRELVGRIVGRVPQGWEDLAA